MFDTQHSNTPVAGATHGPAFTFDHRAIAPGRSACALAIMPSAIGSVVRLPLRAASTERRTVAGASGERTVGVGIMRIDGPLAQRGEVTFFGGIVDGYDFVTQRLATLLDASDVGAVVVAVNSPGGDVAGLEEAVRRMGALKTKSGKPIVVFADELAASAAFWIAAGIGDEIMLPPMAEVGSIGTIGAWVDESEAVKRRGIVVHVHRAPPGKAPMLSVAPVADVADRELAASVMSSTETFMAAVQNARGVDGAKLRDLNGGLLRGQAAVDAGLADRVGSLEDAIARAAELARKATPARSGLFATTTREPTTTAELIADMLADGRIRPGSNTAAELAGKPFEAVKVYADTIIPALSPPQIDLSALKAMAGGPAAESPLTARQRNVCREKGVDERAFARRMAITAASRGDKAEADRLLAWAAGASAAPARDGASAANPLTEREQAMLVRQGLEFASYARVLLKQRNPRDEHRMAALQAFVDHADGIGHSRTVVTNDGESVAVVVTHDDGARAQRLGTTLDVALRVRATQERRAARGRR